MVDIGQTDTIVATALDGRTTVKTSVCEVVVSGMLHFSITVDFLTNIDAVLDIKTTSTDPATTAYGPQNIKVSGAVVGFTLHDVASGTSLCLEIVSQGF